MKGKLSKAVLNLFITNYDIPKKNSITLSCWDGRDENEITLGVHANSYVN